MNIGIDISQIVYKGSGVARFTEGLVHTILEYDKKNTWTFVFFGLRQKLNPALVEKIRATRHTLIQRPIPPSILKVLHNTIHKETSRVTYAGIAVKTFDWFITSDWTEPMLHCKKATIVHDLVFKRYPETVHKSIRDTQEERLAWVAKESDVVFTDSEATAKDLAQHYRVADKKIVVNYPGINFEKYTPADIVNFEEVQQNHTIPGNYILTVGKLEPRKNIARLLEAYAQIETDIQLVIVGLKGWGDIPETHDKRVRFVGYMTDDELIALYKHASAFALPSLYEGFGYPVVEAMKYGCPVLTSDTSSLKEIASDCAVLVDPEDTNSIRAGLERLISDKALQEELQKKGKIRAAEFTWERYYETLIQTLKRNNV
ncbi:glycosyltransferase family 4 protein [Candidatus Woesebacteria bacterium]|nr:glycosyltransferase family 4 protein [Candidatus Woesebacteria bacterium]